MNNKSPAFQFYPGDFLSDENVISMNFEERGIYITLLCSCWIQGSIPADPDKIMRLLPGYINENGVPSQVLECFEEMEGNSKRLVHPRLDKERQKQADFKEGKSNAGKRSARLREARKKGTHTIDEWETLKNRVGTNCPRCGEECFNFDKDHVTPIYQGGSDSIGNLQPLCPSCNAQKGPESIDYVLRFRSNTVDNVLPTKSNSLSLSSSSSSSSLNLNTHTIYKNFEEDWNLYPRKAGNKIKARVCYHKSVGKDPDKRKLFLEKMQAYVSNTDIEYLKHGETFFRNWEALVVDTVKSRKNGNRESTPMEQAINSRGKFVDKVLNDMEVMLAIPNAYKTKELAGKSLIDSTPEEDKEAVSLILHNFYFHHEKEP